MQPWKKHVIRGEISALEGIAPAGVVLARPYVVCQRVDARSDGLHVIGVHEILYFFLGSPPSTRLIRAQWVPGVSFDENSVYIRTSKGIFRVFVDGMAALASLMSDVELAPLNRSLTVRLDAIRLLDATAHVMVYAGGTLESLQAGQRDFERLLRRYGVTRRIFR